MHQPVTVQPRYDDPAPPLRLVRPRHEQLALDLQWEVAPGIPAVPVVPALLHVVGDPGDVGSLPDPARWAAQLARAVGEVMTGARPVTQLTRWVTRTEVQRLSFRAAAMGRHPSARGRRPQPRSVRAVRVCPVGPGVVETSAVLIGGERAQAVAIRLEAAEGRWLATVVDIR
jgi:hypothetical protein